MAEGVRIDVGQTVAAGKIIEPSGDAVRVHAASIVCCEHKAAVYPPVTIGKLQAELFQLMPPQQLHGFGG